MSIGSSQGRVDAPAKVTGEALYPGDLPVPDALEAVAVFSGKVHARMISMDTRRAEAVPGVVAVFTAADVPVNEYGLTMPDQPVLVGVGGTGRAAVAADVSRWDADHIAVIVAETREAAREAAELLDVEWADLGHAADIDAAIAPDAPLLHPENGLATNRYLHFRARKGDPEAAWREAAVVVEATYELPYQEHGYLQPEAAVAYVDAEGRITVQVAGQWTHEDRAQIAHALDLPEEAVRVVYPAIGGAFGGREDMTLQIVLALAAWKLAARGERRPVRCVWSREESIVGHHKRHRGRIHARWGADADGTLLVVETDAFLDAGAYNYTTNKVLGNLHLTVAGPYRVPHARIDSSGVYSTSVPTGAFRGFGAPQGAFVAEMQMNKLAEALGIDPVELRRRNLLRDGDASITHEPLPEGVSVLEVVERCAGAAAWGEPPTPVPGMRPYRTLPPVAPLRGRGVACAFKNIGFSFGFTERSEARIELHGDTVVERAVLYSSSADVGQGSHTALRQIAAEALGLAPEAVETVWSDTAVSGDFGSASASRSTFMGGNAILGAAEEAQKRWQEGARPAFGEFRFVPPATEHLAEDGGPSRPNFAYTYAAEVVDVSVDPESGMIRVDRVVAVTDTGRTINPRLVAGQTEGAVVQAHGYAVTERLVVADGRILNPRLSQYLIPGIGDIPTTVETVFFEHPDPLGPYGARGVGELPFMPYAPALAAAIHDATGIWFDSIPLTPDRVVAALRRD